MQSFNVNKVKIPKNLSDTSKNPFENREDFACVFKDLRLAAVTACVTTENTEAIVCPSNPDLLSLTGIAWIVHRKGGTRIREECVRVLEERGKIEPGKAVSTSGGQLNCLQVLHCVGPQVFLNIQTAESQLKLAIQGALSLCEVHSHASISIPLMNYGQMMAFSKEKSAHLIFTAVIDYLLRKSRTIIKHIRFTNLDKSITQIFVKILQHFQAQYLQILATKSFADNYFFFDKTQKPVKIDPPSRTPALSSGSPSPQLVTPPQQLTPPE